MRILKEVNIREVVEIQGQDSQAGKTSKKVDNYSVISAI